MNLKSLPLNAVFSKALSQAVVNGDTKESATAKAKLMVVLHGRGDSPAGFSWMPNTMALPELNYLFLQAPDDYYGGYSWYGMPPNQRPGILRSRKLLEATFAEIFAQGYLPENIILFGFSQGCLMTLEFGGRFSPKLCGYIGVSGYVYDAKLLAAEADPEAKTGHWLVTHGTRDEVLPIADTRAQIDLLQASGFNIDYREYEKVHTLDDLKEIPFLRDWTSARIKENP
jgi:phospholipase/carboxylesterase